MASIALICLYDDWALGTRTLTNALLVNGHEVNVIHFKLPSHERIDEFQKRPRLYENMLSNHGLNSNRFEFTLLGHNSDVNMWNEKELELLGDELKRIKPSLVGVSVRSVYEDDIDGIFEQAKKVDGVTTIAGGFGAILEPEKYLDKADFVCIGEGEDSMIALANHLEKKTPVTEIPTVIYRRNGVDYRNTVVAPDDANDYFFDSCMTKAKHIVIEDEKVVTDDFLLSGYTLQGDKEPGTYYTMAGRGCPHRCTFCAAYKTHDLYKANGVKMKSRRNRPPEKIIEELLFARQTFGIGRVTFMDSFLVGSNAFLSKLFALYEKYIKLPFFGQLYPEQIIRNPSLLEQAYRAGLRCTVVGIQSGSESCRKEILNRKVTNETILRFAQLVDQYPGITYDYHLLTHNPFETQEDHELTLDLINKLPKGNSQLCLNRLRPFKGTEMYKRFKESNIDYVDGQEDHRRFMMCLLRYYSSDKIFDAIRKRSANLTFKQLVTLYEHVRNDAGTGARRESHSKATDQVEHSI